MNCQQNPYLVANKLHPMKKLCIILSAATITLLFSCSQPATPAADDFNLDSAKAAVIAGETAFMDAVSKGDSAAAAALYTKDACLMMQDMEKICGQDKIGSFLASFKKMGASAIKAHTVEVIGGKDILAEEGTYEISDSTGTTIETGKYLCTWKKEDGKWKMYRDMPSSNARH